MKNLIALCAVALLGGCAYTIPGVSAPKFVADFCSQLRAAGTECTDKPTPAQPDRPDRDLLAALVVGIAGIEADFRAGRLLVPIGVNPNEFVFAEFNRRENGVLLVLAERRATRATQYAATGSADCGAWHWNNVKLACLP